MDDPRLTLDIAVAASTTTSSPSLHLHCRGEGSGEGEGLEALMDRRVASDNKEWPHLPPSSPMPPPLSNSAPLSLVCCSHSTSNRPANREHKRVMRDRRIEGWEEQIEIHPIFKHACIVYTEKVQLQGKHKNGTQRIKRGKEKIMNEGTGT